MFPKENPFVPFVGYSITHFYINVNTLFYYFIIFFIFLWILLKNIETKKFYSILESAKRGKKEILKDSPKHKTREPLPRKKQGF